MLLAAPEFWVLGMACIILVVDLFLSKERRGIIHLLAMITLVFAAIITMRSEYAAEGARSALAFNGSFIRDPMGDVLKMFSFLILGLVYIYSKFCLRQFRMFRADFYTLSLFALLGVMLLISANSLVMIYLGLELTSLSSYALVAFDRDSRLGSEAAMKYFVLGSMASGMLLYGMSMIYGALPVPWISTRWRKRCKTIGSDDPLLIFGLVFLVVGLSFKLGVVPFHMWIPDVYHGAPLSPPHCSSPRCPSWPPSPWRFRLLATRTWVTCTPTGQQMLMRAGHACPSSSATWPPSCPEQHQAHAGVFDHFTHGVRAPGNVAR